MNWVSMVIVTIVCWGVYGVLLHQGRMSMGSAQRAFLWVGIAYFLVAIIGPLVVMELRSEPGTYTTKGVSFALAAGIAGAVGAFAVILAFGFGGSPAVVMPLVFAGAPIVNTAATLLLHPPKATPSPMFFAGICLAAAGTWLFMSNAPR